MVTCCLLSLSSQRRRHDNGCDAFWTWTVVKSFLFFSWKLIFRFCLYISWNPGINTHWVRFSRNNTCIHNSVVNIEINGSSTQNLGITPNGYYTECSLYRKVFCHSIIPNPITPNFIGLICGLSWMWSTNPTMNWNQPSFPIFLLSKITS